MDTKGADTKIKGQDIRQLIVDLISEDKAKGQEYPQSQAYLNYYDSLEKETNPKEIKLVTYELDSFLKNADRNSYQINEKADKIRDFLFDYLLEKRKQVTTQYDTKELRKELEIIKKQLIKTYKYPADFVEKAQSQGQREARDVLIKIDNAISILESPESVGLFEQSETSSIKTEVLSELNMAKKHAKRAWIATLETGIDRIKEMALKALKNPIKPKIFALGGNLRSLMSREAIEASNPFAIRKKIQFAKNHPEVFMLEKGGDIKDQTPEEKANAFHNFYRKMKDIARLPKSLNVLNFAKQEIVGLSNNANDVILKALVRNRVPFIIITEEWLQTQKVFDRNSIERAMKGAIFFNMYGIGQNINTNAVFCSTMGQSIEGLMNYAVKFRSTVQRQYQEGFMHECIHAYLNTLGFDYMTNKRKDMLKINEHILHYLKKNPKELEENPKGEGGYNNYAAHIFATVIDATKPRSSVDELITWSYTTPKIKEFFEKIVLSSGKSIMQHIRNVVNSFDTEKALESYFQNKYEGSELALGEMERIEIEMLKMENELMKKKLEDRGEKMEGGGIIEVESPKEEIKTVVELYGLIGAIRNNEIRGYIAIQEPEISEYLNNVYQQLRLLEYSLNVYFNEVALFNHTPNGFIVATFSPYKETPLDELPKGLQEKASAIIDVLLDIINYVGLDASEFGIKYEGGGNILNAKEITDYLSLQVEKDRKEYKGHIPSKYNPKGKEFDANSWLVSEIMQFLQKDFTTSYVLMKFGERDTFGIHNYTLLNGIIKTAYPMEYAEAEKLLKEYADGGEIPRKVSTKLGEFGLFEFSELKDYGKTMAIDHMRDEREKALRKGRSIDYNNYWYYLDGTVFGKKNKSDKVLEKGGVVQIQYDDNISLLNINVNNIHIGIIQFTETNDNYEIIDAEIINKYKGKGYYKSAILEFAKTNPNKKIISNHRSKEAEFAWQSLLKYLPPNYKYDKKKLNDEHKNKEYTQIRLWYNDKINKSDKILEAGGVVEDSDNEKIENLENAKNSAIFVPEITEKDEIQQILLGTSQVSNGYAVQAAASYLRASESASPLVKQPKQAKNQQKNRLIKYASENNLWFDKSNLKNFLDRGGEQKVYLIDGKNVIKVNSSIYYDNWLDYFNSLLLHNYFFPDTSYELIGFILDGGLFAVVKQPYVKATQLTDLDFVEKFMSDKGFYRVIKEAIPTNDYKNSELDISIEDLHTENVLTKEGELCFIDTIFYIDYDSVLRFKKGGDVSVAEKLGVSEKETKNIFHLPYEFTIYVPSTKGVSENIPKEEFQKRIKEVETKLANLFGGFSASDIQGGYMSTKQELVSEKIVKVTSYCTAEAFNQNKSKLLQQISNWSVEWEQEAIGLEFEGDLMYVPQKLEKGGNMTDTAKYKNRDIVYYSLDREDDKIAKVIGNARWNKEDKHWEYKLRKMLPYTFEFEGEFPMGLFADFTPERNIYGIVGDTQIVKSDNVSAAGFEIYHETLGGAISECEKYAKANGYQIGTYFPDLGIGGGVGYGDTKHSMLDLLRNGKVVNYLHISIYRMDGGTYELTCYFTKSLPIDKGQIEINAVAEEIEKMKDELDAKTSNGSIANNNWNDEAYQKGRSDADSIYQLHGIKIIKEIAKYVTHGKDLYSKGKIERAREIAANKLEKGGSVTEDLCPEVGYRASQSEYLAMVKCKPMYEVGFADYKNALTAEWDKEDKSVIHYFFDGKEIASYDTNGDSNYVEIRKVYNKLVKDSIIKAISEGKLNDVSKRVLEMYYPEYVNQIISEKPVESKSEAKIETYSEFFERLKTKQGKIKFIEFIKNPPKVLYREVLDSTKGYITEVWNYQYGSQHTFGVVYRLQNSSRQYPIQRVYKMFINGEFLLDKFEEPIKNNADEVVVKHEKYDFYYDKWMSELQADANKSNKTYYLFDYIAKEPVRDKKHFDRILANKNIKSISFTDESDLNICKRREAFNILKTLFLWLK
jgi:hypothetical protein